MEAPNRLPLPNYGLIVLGLPLLLSPLLIAALLPEQADGLGPYLRILAALGGGSVGAVIPGLLEVKFAVAKGAGALAIFALIYLVDPSSLVGKSTSQSLQNPFFRDVPNSTSPQVKDFAATHRLTGGPNDVNASNWVKSRASEQFDAPDGSWKSRWNENSEPGHWNIGSAQIRVQDKMVFILFYDNVGLYLIKASIEPEGRLVGGYVNLVEGDNSPWVGLLVDNRRIDGEWINGRCDFRR